MGGGWGQGKRGSKGNEARGAKGASEAREGRRATGARGARGARAVGGEKRAGEGSEGARGGTKASSRPRVAAAGRLGLAAAAAVPAATRTWSRHLNARRISRAVPGRGGVSASCSSTSWVSRLPDTSRRSSTSATLAWRGQPATQRAEERSAGREAGGRLPCRRRGCAPGRVRGCRLLRAPRR